MKRILVFSGSNHAASINQQLVTYAASLIPEAAINVLDISKWSIPVYSIDMDPDHTPDKISHMIDLIRNHDGFIVSSPEHNGSTPAFFKNIIDWLSRRSKNVFEGKSMLLMSTSPGKYGGVNNRKHLEKIFPYLGVNITSTFSLPSFYQNMQNQELNAALRDELNDAIIRFLDSVKTPNYHYEY